MRTRRSWTVLTLAAIWLSVLFASLFAPDMVTGSEQNHVPLAAIATWLFGLAATRSVIKMMARPRDAQREADGICKVGGIGVVAIWLVVGLVSVFAPVAVTGSDPTRMPVAVIIAPIAGMLLTGLLAQIAEVRLRS